MKTDPLPRRTLLLGAAGMLSLLPAAGPHGALLLVALGLLVVWSLAERRTPARLPKPPARAADLLVVTSILAIAILHASHSNASLLTVGHILAVSFLTRAFRRKTRQDLVIMNATAVGMAALAAFLTRTPMLLPGLLAVIVLAVASSLQLIRLGGAAGRGVRTFTARPRGPAGLRARVGGLLESMALALLVLLCGGVVFVLLPRGRPFVKEDGEPMVSYSALGNGVRSGRGEGSGPPAYTGLSDHVLLGEVGRIKENLREAFTVCIREGRRIFRSTGQLYFRAAVFDTFDGLEWTRRIEPPGGERWLTAESLPCRIPVRAAAVPRLPGTALLRQEFRMRATFARSLPAAGRILSVRLDSELPKVLLMSGGTLAAPRGLPATGLAYEVTSLVSMREGRPAFVEPIEDGQKRILLAVPPGLTRLERQAGKVAGTGSPMEKAAKIEAWLEKTCEYTLKFRPRPSGRPVHDFLFTTHAGHCEYFASAEALMLRAVGVPSRLVTGYRGGLWIEHLRSYFVRMSEAHAWVEAWVPGRGWVTLDPTPPDGSAVNVPESRVPGEVEESLAAVSERLAALVTEFGPREREQALSALESALEFLVREGFGPGRPPRPFPPPLTVLAAIGTVLLLIRRLGVRSRGKGRGLRQGRRERRSPPPPETPFYEAAVRLLAAEGIVRRPHLSPREFSDEVRNRRPVGTAPFTELTRTFERVRYGHRRLDIAATEEMDQLLRRLADGLRSPNR